MGYITKDIAVITEPKIVTLSGLPNFVIFESKPSNKIYLELNLEVNLTQSTPGDISTISLLRITDYIGGIREIKGTTDFGKVDSDTFYVSTEASGTAENIQRTLLADNWFRTNYEVIIPFTQSGDTLVNGSVINIKSKGAGVEFNIDITAPNDTVSAYAFAWINRTSQNNDSISGEESETDIMLEVYTDTGVLLGEDDAPTNPHKIGTYITSLPKTYTGKPLWFDLNALFDQYINYNIPPETPGWFDTGTYKDYRFMAKTGKDNSFYFYASSVLYVLSGGGVPFEVNDLSQYVYNGSNVTLLTDKPPTPYVKGQKEYINFILSRQTSINSLRVAYQLYTTSDTYLATLYGQEQLISQFGVVNTCVLDIDNAILNYPTAGIVRVAISASEEIVSNSIEYIIRPECLHMLRQFSFINRLGGWDAFNFDTTLKSDIKPSIETYNRTLTPYLKKGDGIETVYTNTLSETLTVEGAPVTDEVADWLKELASARVVLDWEGDYVIIEDFTLSKTADNFNMQRPTIKYRKTK